MAIKSVPLVRPVTGLAQSESIKPPSGVSKPKPPMIDRKQNVGESNLGKVRWGGPPKLGNHR